MKNNIVIIVYEYFAKRLEIDPSLKLAEIKKHADFKKLQKDEQKKLELKLIKKIDSLKNQTKPKTKSKQKDSKKTSKSKK